MGRRPSERGALYLLVPPSSASPFFSVSLSSPPSLACRPLHCLPSLPPLSYLLTFVAAHVSPTLIISQAPGRARAVAAVAYRADRQHGRLIV